MFPQTLKYYSRNKYGILSKETLLVQKSYYLLTNKLFHVQEFIFIHYKCKNKLL